MKRLNRDIYPKPVLPEKVLQFGEGAFLRAFVDYIFDVLNEKELFHGGITIIQPLPQGTVHLLAKQDGLYTLLNRGLSGGNEVNEKRIISCVQNYLNPYENFDAYMACAKNPELRYIISNTTEAGISYGEGDLLTDKPQKSFPGKITAFLYERYQCFNGDREKGFVFLPCELIDHNGTELKKLVLRYADEWGLLPDFVAWVDEANVFCDTLVDRITTGFPHDEAESLAEELGYRDALLDVSEPFYFWAIEGPEWLNDELRFRDAGLNVIVTDDVSPYKTRKVRLLNGAHTCSVPAALLCGLSTVGEMMADADFKEYLSKALFAEIIPALDIPAETLHEFAAAVLERFSNPFVRHELMSIMLNSVSKFAVRVLPTIMDYYRRFNELPRILAFSFAALIAYYHKQGENAEVQAVYGLIDENRRFADARDLQCCVELKKMTEDTLAEIAECGIRNVIRSLVSRKLSCEQLCHCEKRSDTP